MLTLNNLIIDLSSSSLTRRLADYICLTSPGEVLGKTMDILGRAVNITGAGTYSPEVLQEDSGGQYDIVEMRVTGRGDNRMIATARTRVAINTNVIDGGHARFEWRELHAVRPGDEIIVPVVQGECLGMASSPARSVRRTKMPFDVYKTIDRAVKAQRVFSKLQLERGAFSYATICGIVATKDAA